jgi:hypothetical protein
MKYSSNLFSFEKIWKTQKRTFVDKIKLLFCKKKVCIDESECKKIIYKQFKNGKLFILNVFDITTQHFNCRCQVIPIIKENKND